MRKTAAAIAAAILCGGGVPAPAAAAAPPAAPQCPPLAGAAEVLALTGKRYILFGEIRGTVEAPALFGDLVCVAASAGPVIVSLDLEEGQQAPLEAYLSSDGSPAARAALTGTRHWSTAVDGTASGAMLALVEQLRLLKKRGLPLSLITSRRNPGGTGSAASKAMADIWMASLKARPGARLLALVGNFQAMRKPLNGGVAAQVPPALAHPPAAAHLPAAETLSLNAASVGGFAWHCQQECKVHDLRERPRKIHPRAILPIPVEDPDSRQFDRWYSPGAAFTASPPVSVKEL
ncbi:MAG TPA: hypothetical protein VF589_07235 [Allosphingosinicella sp.]|jgi:hypothetical protein